MTAVDDDEVDEFDDLDQWDETKSKTAATKGGSSEKKTAKASGDGKKQAAASPAAKKKKQQQMLEKQKILKEKQEANGVSPAVDREQPAAATEPDAPDLSIEMIAMTLILIYTINYVIGSRKNKAVAQILHDQCKEAFVSLFTQVVRKNISHIHHQRSLFHRMIEDTHTWPSVHEHAPPLAHALAHVHRF